MLIKKEVQYGFTDQRGGLFFEGFFNKPLDNNCDVVSMRVKTTEEPIIILYTVNVARFADSHIESVRVETNSDYRNAEHFQHIFAVADEAFDAFSDKQESQINNQEQND
jgi:hypothetical protein